LISERLCCIGLNHFSAEKAWWISNVLQPAGDIFIRLIKMIVIPIVISSLIVGIAGVGDAKKLGRIGVKTILYFEIVTTIAIVVGLLLANLFHPGAGIDQHITALAGERRSCAARSKSPIARARRSAGRPARRRR